MKTTTLEMEEEERLQTAEDPEAPAETSVREEAQSDQRIAELAYRHWQERGCPYGSPEEDWYRAEEELRHTRAA